MMTTRKAHIAGVGSVAVLALFLASSGVNAQAPPSKLALFVQGQGHVNVQHLALAADTSVDLTAVGFGGSLSLNCASFPSGLSFRLDVDPSTGGGLHHWENNQGDASIGTSFVISSNALNNSLQFDTDIVNDADNTVVHIHGLLRFVGSGCDAFLTLTTP